MTAELIEGLSDAKYHANPRLGSSTVKAMLGANPKDPRGNWERTAPKS